MQPDGLAKIQSLEHRVDGECETGQRGMPHGVAGGERRYAVARVRGDGPARRVDDEHNNGSAREIRADFPGESRLRITGGENLNRGIRRAIRGFSSSEAKRVERLAAEVSNVPNQRRKLVPGRGEFESPFVDAASTPTVPTTKRELAELTMVGSRQLSDGIAPNVLYSLLTFGEHCALF